MMCYPTSGYIIIFSLRKLKPFAGRGPDNPNTLVCLHHELLITKLNAYETYTFLKAIVLNNTKTKKEIEWHIQFVA